MLVGHISSSISNKQKQAYFIYDKKLSIFKGTPLFVHRRDNHTKGDNPAGVVVPGGDDIEPAAVV